MIRLSLIALLLISGCITKRVATTSNVVILDGSASRIINGDGNGYFTSWQWRQISGSPSLILNSSALITQTTISGSGVYKWELTGRDNIGNVAKDTFSVIIN